MQSDNALLHFIGTGVHTIPGREFATTLLHCIYLELREAPSIQPEALLLERAVAIRIRGA